MDKIDLIIDALEQYVNVVVSHNDSNNFRVQIKDGGEPARKALAAARELKELCPQGAKVSPAEFITAASIGVGADFVGTPMMWAEWPTRSEEVKHD